MSAEGPQMREALKSAQARGENQDLDWPRDERGVPMVKISCAASELVATQAYSNVTIGPMSVTRFVKDDEHLPQAMQQTQSLCEDACSQERESVHVLMRSRAKAA